MDDRYIGAAINSRGEASDAERQEYKRLAQDAGISEEEAEDLIAGASASDGDLHAEILFGRSGTL